MKLNFEIESYTASFTTTLIKPDYSGMKYFINNSNGRGKFEVSGIIYLYGEDYDFITTTADDDWVINAYIGADFYFQTTYRISNIVFKDKDFKKIGIKVVAWTNYNNEYWKNFDKKYNINEVTPQSNDLYFLPGYIPINRYSATFTGERLSNDTEVNAALLVSGYDIEYIDNLTGIYDNVGGFWEYSGTVHYVREQTIGYYIDGTKYEPDGDGGWVYIADKTINGVVYPEYYRIDGTNGYNYTPGAEPWTYIDNAVLVFNRPAINYTGVTRSVEDVIEWLFNETGITINFDNTGTSTDSFYGLEEITGETLTYNSTSSDKPYSYLLIMNLTDFIPAADDGQKDMPAEKTMISLKTLLDWFESLGFIWYFEDRSGSDYFMIKHRTKISLGSSNPDLMQYYNRDRLYLENHNDNSEPKYSKIKNEQTCKSIDFVGTEVNFDNIYNDTSISFVSNNIYTDLNDIAYRRSSVYDEEDVSNIVMIAAQYTSGQDYIREATTILTAAKTNNSELSFSYLVKNILCQLPDETMSANGVTYTVTSSRLEKREKIKLTVPCDNIQSDFDVYDYVDFFGENAEILKISQKYDNNICELELIK